MELKTREKQLEDQKAEIMASMAETESKLEEAKKQHDHMLESKHLELSKHLKEISQKNDQADKVIQERKKNTSRRLKNTKKNRQHLLQVQEEHAALISNIQQQHANKETSLISKHTEELKLAQLQAETELREEERQRALLQLQWKVMGDNPQEDQEVNSKKNYSISSTKMRNKDGSKRIQHALDRTEVEEKDSPYLKATETPVSNLLKKVENVNSLPKHSRKVTHHEYEIETSNGRTITKRRKTKSTVMFGDPRKHRKKDTPKARTPKNVIQASTD
ncbi:UNVERIFIED_CONTAM: Synaptonemal complex protein ZEP1 [Sesamum radiatum]|uniref:Synaptonemal complex protein ZEP1 n=1 Tax=Sesamum radiatum TaxID=300843 RepID=A0AAW2M7Z7_SESRA